VTSIHDVARAAGVSPATVSRALRGMDRVSPQTRSKVLAAAQELSYVASPSATSLVSGKTSVVGVVVPFLNRWFFSSVLDGTEQLLRQHGYHLLLFNVGRGSARTLMLDQRLLWKRVDALLVLSADLEPEEVALLAALHVPLVAVDVDLPGWDRVGIDDRHAAELATEHLLDLGHRRIAYVGGNPEEDVHLATALDREAGVVAALSRRGLELDSACRVRGDWTVRGGRDAGERLLSLPQPPTAVVAASDEMAIGVLCAARERGRIVPRDLSVVGIDDHDLAFTHDLTTVAQPVHEQGRLAAQLLLDALAETGPHQRQVRNLPVELVVRGSTAPVCS
jgi:LacI family repressor for deo operon, udp, cdd, tsx, nupC, and nupG